MWRIYLGEELLHAPDLGTAVDDPVLVKAVNAADSLKFDIHPDHPLYARCKSGVLTEGYRVERDGQEVSRGRILARTVRPLDAVCEVECEGELAYLNDAVMPQYDFSGTPSALMARYLDAYNDQADEPIRLGTVDDALDPNGYIVRGSENPVNLMEELLAKTVNSSTGGVIELRREGETRYLDWLPAPTATGRQSIEMGANLLDLSDTLDGSEIVTAILPLGQRGEGGFVGLPSGDDGQVSGDVWRRGEWLYNKALTDAYGWHGTVMKWEDVTLPANLLTKATAACAALSFAPSFELSAIDLTDAGYDTDHLAVGQPVQVTCGDISERYTLTQAEWHLSDPSQSSYTFGRLVKSTDTQPAADSAGWSGAADNGNYFWHKTVEHVDEDETRLPWHEDNSYISPHPKGDIENWFWPQTGDPNVEGTWPLPHIDMWWREQYNNWMPTGGMRVYTSEESEIRSNGIIRLIDMTPGAAVQRAVIDMNADGADYDGNPYIEIPEGTDLIVHGVSIPDGSGGGVNVDTALDATSANPVRNSAITAAINQRVQMTTTAGSTTALTGSHVDRNGTTQPVRLWTASEAGNWGLVADKTKVFLYGAETGGTMATVWAAFTTKNEPNQAQVIPVFYQAGGRTSDGSTIATTANTITQVPVAAADSMYVNTGSAFSIASGGVRINATGTYRITASTYTTGSGATYKGTYVRKGTAFSTATEVMGLTQAYTASACQVGPKLVLCNQNDIIFLATRLGGVAGTCYKDNAQTYLLIERVR